MFTHADVNVVDQNAESREDLCKKTGNKPWLITWQNFLNSIPMWFAQFLRHE